MHVQVNSEQVGTAAVVHAAGELDLHTAGSLQDALDAAVAAQAPLIVVDLAAVDFMDSTGLSVIVATVAAVREQDGEVRVVTATEKIKKVFTLTGIDQQVRMFATVEEALA